MLTHDGVWYPADGLGYHKTTTFASLPWSACNQLIDHVGLLRHNTRRGWYHAAHSSFLKVLESRLVLPLSERNFHPEGIVQTAPLFHSVYSRLVYGDCISYLGRRTYLMLNCSIWNHGRIWLFQYDSGRFCWHRMLAQSDGKQYLPQWNWSL